MAPILNQRILLTLLYVDKIKAPSNVNTLKKYFSGHTEIQQLDRRSTSVVVVKYSATDAVRGGVTGGGVCALNRARFLCARNGLNGEQGRPPEGSTKRGKRGRGKFFLGGKGWRVPNML